LHGKGLEIAAMHAFGRVLNGERAIALYSQKVRPLSSVLGTVPFGFVARQAGVSTTP